jgi:hypothetical protein
MRGSLLMVLALAGCATKPEMSGSAMPLNMTPLRPTFAGAYDFRLLGTVHGESCVTRENMEISVYWVALNDLEKMSGDQLTRRAIAAASFQAIKGLDTIDALVVTRVVAEGHGPDKVCATVWGRAVQLTKYEGPPPAAAAATPPTEETR